MLTYKLRKRQIIANCSSEPTYGGTFVPTEDALESIDTFFCQVKIVVSIFYIFTINIKFVNIQIYIYMYMFSLVLNLSMYFKGTKKIYQHYNFSDII